MKKKKVIAQKYIPIRRIGILKTVVFITIMDYWGASALWWGIFGTLWGILTIVSWAVYFNEEEVDILKEEKPTFRERVVEKMREMEKQN